MRVYKNNALPRQHLSKLHSWRKVSKKCANRQDLGVTISNALSWNKHVGIRTNKANKVLGIIKKTVDMANQDIFSILCKSLVRPILEYAAPVWSPYLLTLSYTGGRGRQKVPALISKIRILAMNTTTATKFGDFS